MTLCETPSIPARRLLVLAALLALQGCATPQPDSAVQPAQAEAEAVPAPTDLLGHWCREKKRMITSYTINEDKLNIVSGRSGRTYQADLSCNDTYTECTAKTIRGWGTPVTEIMRLDGNGMKLTRVWGGAWNDKTYNFAFTRCPRW